MMFSLLHFPVIFLAKVGDACKAPGGGGFFGLPHWWQYLNFKVNDINQCAPDFNPPSDILAVVLAVINMLLFVAGLAAVVSIIVAGVSYITAAGATDKITSSRKRIQNALIGLAIVFVASAAVSFIGNNLG